jgi:hypothetical protein
MNLVEPDTAQLPAARSNTVLILKKAPLEVLDDLSHRGRSFVDIRRGRVRLQLPSLLIDREGLRPPIDTPSPRALRDPFGDRASLISRALVEYPSRTWQTRELAAAVGVSTMTASHVVRQLNELGIVEVRKSGTSHVIRLRNLTGLVSQWASRYDWRQNEQLVVDAPVGGTERFLRRLADALKGRHWALTLQAGANLIAPHATSDKIHAYVELEEDEQLRDIAASRGWAPGEGKLVLLSPRYRHSAWYGERDVQGLKVVSDLQLVLDLWNYPVRGREQAEHVLRIMTKAFGDAQRAT